jgi:hypothetical protein
MTNVLISALVVLAVTAIGAQTYWISRALARVEAELAQLRAELGEHRDQTHRDLLELATRVGRLEGEHAPGS